VRGFDGVNRESGVILLCSLVPKDETKAAQGFDGVNRESGVILLSSLVPKDETKAVQGFDGVNRESGRNFTEQSRPQRRDQSRARL
jgi:hypothetical protein